MPYPLLRLHPARCASTSIAWPDLLDTAFRLNIAALTNSRQSSAAIDDMHWCGPELDPLALDLDDPYGVKALHLSLMRLIRPTRTAAAVVSV